MPKIKKVTIEYEDGTGKFIENEMAELWDRYCASSAMSLVNRGMNPPWEKIEWKEIKKEEKLYY